LLNFISERTVTTFVTRTGGKEQERTEKDRTNRKLQVSEIATNLGKPLQ
jgi:hypothetical protein